VEDRALGLALEFTGMKERAQADEEQLSLALDLYNVLDSLESPTFTPGEVVNQLAGCDSWGATFSRSGGGSPQAHAAKVGKFLKAFGLTSNRNGKRGCVYATNEVLRKIKSHLPDNLSRNCTRQFSEGSEGSEGSRRVSCPDGIAVRVCCFALLRATQPCGPDS